MNNHSNVYTILVRLVQDWPAGGESEALAAAQSWLKTHKTSDIRALTQDTIAALDTLLNTLEGGAARDALLDARKALAAYLQHEAGQRDTTLEVKLTPAGGVTLVRQGRHFTISDEDLEAVREAINVRKREIRKRQRRET